jgi:hypothetical protein
VKAGVIEDTSVLSTDWLPTLAALAGVDSPKNLDGVSLAGLFTRGEMLSTRLLYWHLPHYTNQGSRPSGAIRHGDWKLIEHYEDGRCELFNLARDVGETTDVSSKEPARVADLRGQLEKWRRDVGAQENSANPKFNGKPWRQLYRDIDTSRLPAETKASTMAMKLDAWRTLMNDVLPRRGPDARASIDPGAGAVMLHARQAKVHGDKLRYESAPQKDTLGFWTQREDWVEWEFEAAAAGVFEVELLQGCGKGSGGAEVEIAVASQTLPLKVEETGHFQRFVPRTAGTVKLEKPGRYTLKVKAKSKPGAAVMDLRRILLRAAP